jgi:hypothetical protein
MKIPPQIPPIYEPSYNQTFGIYLRTRKTGYGHCDIGKFKGNNIEIYHDNETKSKLYYVSDNLRNWIKSKLIYFERGFKKIVRSENARIY